MNYKNYTLKINKLNKYINIDFIKKYVNLNETKIIF